MADGDLPELRGLVVGDDAAAWRKAGFAVDDSGRCRVGAVTIALVGASEPRGIRSWVLTGVDGGDIDGLATEAQPPGPAPGPGAEHANTAGCIDHVVVLSPDVDRTTAAFERRGILLRRTRHVDPEHYGFPARQVFFRTGQAIVEVIGPDEPRPGADSKPARFYGLAHTVADLDRTSEVLVHHLGPVKDAVQPGRRIATLRHRELGVSVATAFMSPGSSAVG